MFHLRLTKAMSYTGYGFSVTKKNPDVFTEDKDVVETLTNSGYFQPVEGTGGLQPPEQQPEENAAGEDENADSSIPDGILSEPHENASATTGGEGKKGKTLDEMSRAELETFATYKNVSVKGLPKKTDIIAKLRETLGPEETGGIIEYGSPAMTELQQ